jgi:hypothetical protein
MLFTLEIVQAAQYVRSTARRHDNATIKLGVAVNLVADLAGTMACCATAHLYLVTHWVCNFRSSIPAHADLRIPGQC